MHQPPEDRVAWTPGNQACLNRLRLRQAKAEQGGRDQLRRLIDGHRDYAELEWDDYLERNAAAFIAALTPLTKGDSMTTAVTLTNQWSTVVSSNISALKYDAAGKRLFVRFSNGTVYSYANVTQQIADEVFNAESVGRTFNSIVKAYQTVYPYQREEG